jgi:dTDP-4-dehydrorhamnose reductase
MTVLVTGAGGQLGLDLLDALANRAVIGVSRQELDITDRAAVERTVTALRPEVVVNCAAWTDVDGCETDPDRAELVNATAVGWIAAACARVGAVLVQISTDFVFSSPDPPLGPDGRPRGWREDDPQAPVNAYGRSKASAEALVRAELDRHHIVRAAWLSGARGRNFVTTMLALARERDHLEVVDDQVGSPTTTRELAAAIVRLVDGQAYGTVHLAGAGWCSRYELARTIVELARVDVQMRPVSSSAFPSPARRPGWSALDTTKAAALGIALPDWRVGLEQLLVELGERGG